MSDLTNEELDALERMVREEAEEHGPTWEAELSHIPPDGLEEWWIHTPWAGEGPDASCSQIALSMWEGPARLAADARNALPSLLAEVRRRRALESESAALRRELEEARAALDVAESRKAQAFRDLKSRAEAAESALSEARKESAGLREALRAIETYEPEQEPTGTDTTGCEECAARRERQWPPSLLCEEHYREMAHARDRNTAARAHQHLRMRSIAHEALAASPRETAPAAAPAACGPHGHSFTDCNERFLAEQAAAAPHNPQSEE